MPVTETSTSLGDMSLAIALDASGADDKQVEAIPDSPDTPTKAAITYAWEDAGDKGRFNGYVTLLKTGTYKIVYDDGAAFEVYYSANGANDIFVTHAPKEIWYQILKSIGQTMSGKSFVPYGTHLLQSTAAQDLSKYVVYACDVPYPLAREEDMIWWEQYPSVELSCYAVALRLTGPMPQVGDVAIWWRSTFAEKWSMVKPMNKWESASEDAFADVTIIFQERYPATRQGDPIGLTKLYQNVWYAETIWFCHFTPDETNPTCYWGSKQWKPQGFQEWPLSTWTSDESAMPAA